MKLHKREAKNRHSQKSESLYLIVGLGNPGRKYARNRHNIGFLCIDQLATVAGISVRRKRMKTRLGSGQIGRHKMLLAKPQTFMNNSGQSVAPLCHWYHVEPQRILIIHDDLDLPFGRIRLRPSGGSGGHKGIKSIIAELGHQDFARLRIGIDRPVHGDPIDYVLDDFDRQQAGKLPSIHERMIEIVGYWLDHGVQETMNAYNGKLLSPEK